MRAKIVEDLCYIGMKIGMPLGAVKRDIRSLFGNGRIKNTNLLATLLFGKPIKARYKLNTSKSKRLNILTLMIEPFMKDREVETKGDSDE